MHNYGQKENVFLRHKKERRMKTNFNQVKKQINEIVLATMRGEEEQDKQES